MSLQTKSGRIKDWLLYVAIAVLIMDLGLNVCYAPRQDGWFPESAFEMAWVCRNDCNRLRLCNPRMSTVVEKTEALDTAGSILRRTFGPSFRVSLFAGELVVVESLLTN